MEKFFLNPYIWRCLTITNNNIQAAVKSNENQEFLFTAPVMITDTPDCDFHRGEKPFTADEIRFFKESFDDYQIIDKEHQVFKDIGSAKSIGVPVDSFILENDTTYELANGTHETYPKGTWMLTSNVTDPLAQQEILSGKLTGWSPSVNTVEIADLIKEAMATKSSAGQLIHDIKNPATVTVSLVGKPCQSGSKQCKLKREGESMSEDTKALSKIREILGVGESAATKSDFDALAQEIETMKAEHEDAMKSLHDEIGTIVTDAINEALAPIGALKADKKDEEEEEEEAPSETDETEETEKTPNSESADEEEEEEEEEKNKGATKSKTPPIHNGATKSDEEDLDTYTFLGRNADGTRKRN